MLLAHIHAPCLSTQFLHRTLREPAECVCVCAVRPTRTQKRESVSAALDYAIEYLVDFYVKPQTIYDFVFRYFFLPFLPFFSLRRSFVVCLYSWFLCVLSMFHALGRDLFWILDAAALFSAQKCPVCFSFDISLRLFPRRLHAFCVRIAWTLWCGPERAGRLTGGRVNECLAELLQQQFGVYFFFFSFRIRRRCMFFFLFYLIIHIVEVVSF